MKRKRKQNKWMYNYIDFYGIAGYQDLIHWLYEGVKNNMHSRGFADNAAYFLSKYMFMNCPGYEMVVKYRVLWGKL